MILVADVHSKGASRIRVYREFPHEGTTGSDFDNFARIRGAGWEGRGIGVGRNQVAVGREDQTKWPMQHSLIVKDHLSFAEIAGRVSRAFQLVDGVVPLRGDIENIVLAVIGQASRPDDCARCIRRGSVAARDRGRFHHGNSGWRQQDVQARNGARKVPRGIEDIRDE